MCGKPPLHKEYENSTFLINFICSNTDISVEDKDPAQIESLKDRGIQAISYLKRGADAGAET